MTTLQDVLPYDFRGYDDTEAYKYKDVKVVAKYDGTVTAWPGHEKHVFCWWLLENGKRVGWNENPSRGWTFPVLGVERKKKVKTRLVYRAHLAGRRLNGPYHQPEDYTYDTRNAIYALTSKLRHHNTPSTMMSDVGFRLGYDHPDALEMAAAERKFLSGDGAGHKGNKGYFGWKSAALMHSYFTEPHDWVRGFKYLEVSVFEVPECEAYEYPDGQVVFDIQKATVIKIVDNYSDLVNLK